MANRKKRVRLNDDEIVGPNGLKKNGRYKIDAEDQDPMDWDEIVELYADIGMVPEELPSNHGTPLFVRRPDITNRICKLLREGLPYSTVLRLVGVSKPTFLKWMQLGYSGASRQYVVFYVRVTKAEGRAERRALKKLKAHENRDWRVSAWQLERRWPEHWGKKDSLKVQNQEDPLAQGAGARNKEDAAKRIASDEGYRAEARQLLEGTDFGYARTTASDIEEVD